MSRALAIKTPHAVLSIIGTMLGLVVAISMMPDSLLQPGSLRVPALALAIGITLGPVVAIMRSPVSIVHPTSVIAFGLIYWLLLDLIQGLYLIDVSDIAWVEKAFIAIALFTFGVNGSHFIRRPNLPNIVLNAAKRPIHSGLLFKLALIAFILSFLRFAIPSEFDLIRMYNALFQNRWAAPWARGGLGGIDAFLDHMAYFGYVLPPLAVLLYRSEKRLTWRTIMVTFMALVIALLVAQGGGRRVIGALVASAGVSWVLTSRYQGRSLVFLAVFGVPALLIYLQFILVTRTSGIGKAEGFSLDTTLEGGLRVDDNFNRLSQLIEAIPRHAEYVGLDWVIWILARPIPRVLWSGKPLDAGFDLTSYLGMRNVSLTSSVVGESYMAFGLIGCLATGFVFGLIGRALSKLLHMLDFPGAVIMYSVGLLALFLGLRSPIDLVLFSYALFAWVLIFNLIVKRTRFVPPH